MANQPDEQGEVVLSWGDSRIGNIIWDDFQAAAVLDWEMASLGQPEMDLGWFLYFDSQFTDPLGVPRPAGFPSHEETIERYSESMGRPMRDLFFYEIFSGFRFAVVMLRLSDLLLESKVLPAEADMRSNNIATQYLATLLDLEPPSVTRTRHRFRSGQARGVGPVVHDGIPGRAHRDAGRPEPVAQPLRTVGGAHLLLPALEDLVQLVLGRDVGDDVHRHLLLVAGRRLDEEAAEGVLGDVRRRLAQRIELARVLHVVQLVPDPVLVEPLGAQLELG